VLKKSTGITVDFSKSIWWSIRDVKITVGELGKFDVEEICVLSDED